MYFSHLKSQSSFSYRHNFPELKTVGGCLSRSNAKLRVFLLAYGEQCILLTFHQIACQFQETGIYFSGSHTKTVLFRLYLT